MLTRKQIDHFITRQELPAEFRNLIDNHYKPLAAWLIRERPSEKKALLGINGAQGTGKSTLAAFLQFALTEHEKWHVALLSIDDFYLTRDQREELGNTVHPLLKTRGVPGTHDLPLLSGYIRRLRSLGADAELALPRFDKAQDDRAPAETWPVITGPIDLIILEGWCVGSTPQTPDALLEPINRLERDMDPDGKWRYFVNEQLKRGYADLFAKLDYLFFLQAPDFDAVFRWRLEQEIKLAEKSPKDSAGIMNRDQIAEFIQYYERLTRANFVSLPKIADIVLELDQSHDCVRSIYRSGN